MVKVCETCEQECETYVERWREYYEQFGNCFSEQCEAEFSKCCDGDVEERDDDEEEDQTFVGKISSL